MMENGGFGGFFLMSTDGGFVWFFPVLFSELCFAILRIEIN